MEVGEYKIIREMALDKDGEPTGGFGRIFEAEHIYLGKKACIKVNYDREKKEDQKRDVELLKTEARLLWDLDSHHSIPAIRGFFPIGKDRAAMVMKHIDGETIEQIITRNSRMHPEDACGITERLLDVLHFIHSYAVIHSDIKPGNVFYEPSKSDIKLIDFGLAVHSPGRATQPIGYTEKFAAPESLQGLPPIPETDLYGVGMVFLYMLGGDVDAKRFPGDTPEPIVAFCSSLIRYDPVQRPRWKDQRLLKELSDIRYDVFGRRHRK